MAVAYDGSTLAKEHGFQAHVGRCAPRAAGGCARVGRSARQTAIFFNYLSQPDDWTEMRACVRWTREIFAQRAFDRYRGREIQPGADVQSDEQIDEFIRAKVESAYHPSCSCKMAETATRWRWSIRNEGARRRGIEGGRLLHHAVHHHRESERPHDHDRGEGRRSHPGKRHAACGERGILRG